MGGVSPLAALYVEQDINTAVAGYLVGPVAQGEGDGFQAIAATVIQHEFQVGIANNLPIEHAHILRHEYGGGVPRPERREPVHIFQQAVADLRERYLTISLDEGF